MANSRTLLVYVLALVLVCPSSFWVNASTSPVLQPSQYHHPQAPHPQQQQLQHIQEASAASPSAPVGTAQLAASAPVLSTQSVSINSPPKLNVKNGWGLSAGTSRSGPYTSGYSYISGRTMDAPPPYVYMTDNDLAETPPSRSATMLNGIGTGLNGLFGSTFDWKSAAFGGFFTLAAQYLDFPGSMFSGLMPTTTTTPTTTTRKGTTTTATEKVDKISLTNNATTSPNATSLNRRRRSVEADSDLTNLASMVLSAIQSGECMQKSICLLGSQIGGSNKGRLAFTLVDKLIPEAVQENQYFVTLKKALKSGDSFCDKFYCKLH